MPAIGQIKLTWINPVNFNVLESQFFNSIPDALTFAEGRDNWLLFQLQETTGNYNKWFLLPYGSQQQFLRTMLCQKNTAFYMVLSIIIAGAIFGIGYLIGKRYASI